MPPKKKTIFSNWFERKKSREIKEKQYEKETVEEKEKRLIANKESRIQSQSKESEEEKQIRLNKVRQAVSKSRQNESNEQKIKRKESDRFGKIRSKIKRSHPFYNIAKTDQNVEGYYIGKMDSMCQFCSAKFFESERPSDKLFSQCCNKGKVNLEPMNYYPDCFQRLLSDKNNKFHQNFIQNIRCYNSSLAFASMGACIQSPKGSGPYCFRIHGQIYHRVSPATPVIGVKPQYGQLYILDTDEALESRMERKENLKCDPNLINTLDKYFRKNNPYAKAYKMMGEMKKKN